MRERCPEAKLLGKAVLQDYKIDFTIYSPKRKCGCADIVAKPKEEVYGLLYEVSMEDKQTLDKFEGHPIHYKRCRVSISDDNGLRQTAFTYEVVTKSTTTLLTSKHYLGLMQQAAELHDFPKKYKKTLSSFAVLD